MGDACIGWRVPSTAHANLRVVTPDSARGAGGRRTLPEADYPLQELTGRIIAAFYYVHRELGYGFLESVYRKALAVELRHRGMAVDQLVRYEIFHRGVSIGIYEADLVADQSVILEAKTGLVLDPVALVQALTYVKASHLPLGLVLHFGPRAQVKRVVHSRSSSKYPRSRYQPSESHAHESGTAAAEDAEESDAENAEASTDD